MSVNIEYGDYAMQQSWPRIEIAVVIYLAVLCAQSFAQGTIRHGDVVSLNNEKVEVHMVDGLRVNADVKGYIVTADSVTTRIIPQKVANIRVMRIEAPSKRTYKGVIMTRNLNVRSEPNGPVTHTLPYGAVVDVSEEADGWIRVQSEAREGYINSNYVMVIRQDANAKTVQKYGVSMVRNLNVRVLPDSTIIDALLYGEVVDVLEEVPGWVKIKKKGRRRPGYINNRFVTVVNQTPETNVVYTHTAICLVENQIHPFVPDQKYAVLFDEVEPTESSKNAMDNGENRRVARVPRGVSGIEKERNIDFYLRKAMALYNIQNYRMSRIYLEKTLTLIPEDSFALEMIGKTDKALGNQKRTIPPAKPDEVTPTTIEADRLPGIIPSWKIAAQSYIDQKEYKKANIYIQRIMRTKPEDADVKKWVVVIQAALKKAKN